MSGGAYETWTLVGKALSQVGQENRSLRGLLGVWVVIRLVSDDGSKRKEWLVKLVPDDGMKRREWSVGLNCGVGCGVGCGNGLGAGWVGGGSPCQESSVGV